MRTSQVVDAEPDGETGQEETRTVGELSLQFRSRHVRTLGDEVSQHRLADAGTAL